MIQPEKKKNLDCLFFYVPNEIFCIASVIRK